MDLKPFFSALRFLTVLPVPERWCGAEESFRSSPNWYPLVGLLIGAGAILLDFLLQRLFPLPVASALLLVYFVAISGALHLDGLADSADAFFSCRSRERMLEIMKDSRSGPMGVAAVVLLLLLKFTLLLALGGEWRRPVLLGMPLAGRCALTIISYWLPYARPEGGLAGFIRTRQVPHWGAVLFLVAVFLVLFGVSGLFCALAVLLGILLLGRYMRTRIGGYTGDTLGFSCELVELIPALTAVALIHLGVL